MVLAEVEVEYDQVGEDIGTVGQDAEEGQTVQVAVETQSSQHWQQTQQPRGPNNTLHHYTYYKTHKNEQILRKNKRKS